MKTFLNIGYIQLCDAAPIIMAGELGYYKEAGLRVRLTREVGWASIQNKLVLGQLDGAHALGSAPIAATLGINNRPVPCGTGLILNAGGNGITLSKAVWDRGVRNAEDFRAEVRSSRWSRTYTLGVVSPISTHRFILTKWLERCKLQEGEDVQIVTIPPGQAMRNLAAGTLDGFCVGDPWHSLAVEQGIGWTVALGEDLVSDAAEKVFMVRQKFAREHADEHVAIIRAIMKAGEYCQDPDNAKHVADTLARPSYLGIDADVLCRIFQGKYRFGFEKTREEAPLINFYHPSVNRPSAAHAAWFADVLQASPALQSPDALKNIALDDVYWESVFETATA